MSNLYTHQDRNLLSTWVLMGTFLTVVICVGWFLSYYYNDRGILYIAVLVAVFSNFFSYWFSDRIVLKLHKAKLVTREEHFDLWNATENLAITAGLPMPRLYIIEEDALNAFATGRNQEHAIICVTTGLLKILDKNELEGVIAHELSHIGNRDMLLATVAVTLVGFVSIASDIFLRSRIRGRDDSKAGGAILIVGIIFAMLAPLMATLLQLALSRKREFLADASGALLTRYPEGLAGALRKIKTSSIPLKTASNATAHLFIADPFASEKFQGVKKLFQTHPPVDERIRALIG